MPLPLFTDQEGEMGLSLLKQNVVGRNNLNEHVSAPGSFAE